MIKVQSSTVDMDKNAVETNGIVQSSTSEKVLDLKIHSDNITSSENVQGVRLVEKDLDLKIPSVGKVLDKENVQDVQSKNVQGVH